MRRRSTTLVCWICALLALVLALSTGSAARGADDLIEPGVGVYDGPSLDAGHARLAEVLSRVVKPDGVDYAALRADHRALDLYLEQLALAPEPTDPAELKALLIDAYNAWTLALVSRSLPDDQSKWPGWSIKDLGSLTKNPWKKYRFELGGKQTTLDETENRLRALGDPRIHVAINCASRSCPALRGEPYRASTLDAQLDAAAGVFASSDYHVRVEDGGKVVRTNQILDWFGKDFESTGGARAFIANFSGSENVRSALAGGAKLKSFDYDWHLNLASAAK